MPKVTSSILLWARERLGLRLDEAAKKLGINNPENLAKLENGEKEPTQKQLEDMAHIYDVPLLCFFLSEPPPESRKERQFRMPPNIEPLQKGYLKRVIVSSEMKQNMLREMIIDEADGHPEPVPLINSINDVSDKRVVASTLTEKLNFSLDDFRSQKDYNAAFKYLREKTEAAGIFVIMSGDCGSHHTTIDRDSFRGFCLSDSIAPLIILNKNDTKTSYAFTLLHEIVHLACGAMPGKTHKEIEKICDRIAELILLPEEKLPTGSDEISDDILGNLAKQYKVSATMMAHKCLSLGMIDQTTYQDKARFFLQQWRKNKEDDKKKNKGKGSGPSRYTLLRTYLGKPLLAMTRRALAEGSLVPTQASRLLGVRPSAVERFLQP